MKSGRRQRPTATAVRGSGRDAGLPHRRSPRFGVRWDQNSSKLLNPTHQGAVLGCSCPSCSSCTARGSVRLPHGGPATSPLDLGYGLGCAAALHHTMPCAAQGAREPPQKISCYSSGGSASRSQTLPCSGWLGVVMPPPKNAVVCIAQGVVPPP